MNFGQETNSHGFAMLEVFVGMALLAIVVASVTQAYLVNLRLQTKMETMGKIEDVRRYGRQIDCFVTLQNNQAQCDGFSQPVIAAQNQDHQTIITSPLSDLGNGYEIRALCGSTIRESVRLQYRRSGDTVWQELLNQEMLCPCMTAGNCPAYAIVP